MHQTRFVDRLIQLWRLRRAVLEAKAEISVLGTLAKYTYRAGEAIMSKMLTYKSAYTSQLFKARSASFTREEKRLAALTMWEFHLSIQGNTFPLWTRLWYHDKCYTLSGNGTLFCTIKHDQFAAIALVSRAPTNCREKWRKLSLFEERVVLKEHHKISQVKRNMMSNWKLLNNQRVNKLTTELISFCLA